MSFDLEEYQHLVKIAEEQRRRADKAAGALEQVRAQIKSEFQCDTIKEARKLHAEFMGQEAQLEKRYLAALEKLKLEFGDMLEAKDHGSR